MAEAASCLTECGGNEMVVMSRDVRRRAADDAEVSRRDTAALRTT